MARKPSRGSQPKAHSKDPVSLTSRTDLYNRAYRRPGYSGRGFVPEHDEPSGLDNVSDMYPQKQPGRRVRNNIGFGRIAQYETKRRKVDKCTTQELPKKLRRLAQKLDDFVTKFNPDQPRDHRGRWSDGGGISQAEDNPQNYKGMKAEDLVALHALHEGRPSARSARLAHLASSELLSRGYSAETSPSAKGTVWRAPKGGDKGPSMLTSEQALVLLNSGVRLPPELKQQVVRALSKLDDFIEKFDPGEARDAQGRWTVGAADAAIHQQGYVDDKGQLSPEAKQHLVNMTYRGEARSIHHGGYYSGDTSNYAGNYFGGNRRFILTNYYGVNKELSEEVYKALASDASVKDYIDDFINSDDPRFKGKSKEERIQMALGAYYGNN